MKQLLLEKFLKGFSVNCKMNEKKEKKRKEYLRIVRIFKDSCLLWTRLNTIYGLLALIEIEQRKQKLNYYYFYKKTLFLLRVRLRLRFYKNNLYF